MSRKRIVSHFERLAAILALFSALALLNTSWAVTSANAADLLPVNGFLNSDGTLNLASAPHGTFDLRGWNVTLDTARGPILAPAGNGAHAPAAVGDWSALGSNGSGNGSLNRYVYALAVRGSDLYVGGNFTNVSNSGTTLGAADFIAKWDGTKWSALGSNGGRPGDGSLNSVVYALAVSGSDLYVGGYFYDVNNGGTTLGAADFVAKHEINVPTAADLAAFTARANPQQDVVVRWRTGNEMNLVGFNVYRATNKNGIYKQLNRVDCGKTSGRNSRRELFAREQKGESRQNVFLQIGNCARQWSKRVERGAPRKDTVAQRSI